MKKKVKKVIIFLICFFVYDNASSQSLTVNVDFNQKDEQCSIREGILSPHRQTIEFKAQGKSIAKIKLGEPVIVAIADEPEKWGFFQFPSIFRTNDGTLIISWAMRADSYKAYESKNEGNNKMMSKDNGKTWIDYDGSYDTEWYSATKYGDEYLSIYQPKAKDISQIKNFPKAVDDIIHYGIRYKFFRDAELPESLQGIFVRKWTDLYANASQIRTFHAKINDDNLCRYATDDQMFVLWNGDIWQMKNGDIIGCNYRGFYEDSNGGILPSGISFYKWNEAEVSWDLLGKIPFQPDLIADPKGNERKVWGFTEPTFVEMDDGTLVCVFRSSEEEKLTPMYRSVSKDGGRTWTHPVAFTPNGVKPHFLKLGNRSLVLTSGRPGVQVRFNFDGTGENWTEAIDMLRL